MVALLSKLEATSAVLVPEDAIAGAKSHEHRELEAQRRYDGGVA